MKNGIVPIAIALALGFSQQTSAIEFDGFLTAGLAVHDQTQTNGVPVIYLEEIKDDVTFLQDTKFGLQITADVTENMQVIAQMLGASVGNNFDVEFEWAYLDYALNESISVRAGRIKQPIFLISDYLEVGYAYPWIRPPVEAYRNMPVDNIIGVELLYQTKVGSFNLGVQPYFGSNRDAVPGNDTTNFFADNYFGLAVRLENQFMTFQVTTFQTDVSTVDTEGTFNSEGEGSLSVASLSWDIKNIVGYAEFTTRDLQAGNSALAIDDLFPDQDAFYITLGYRMNKYLPHITFASSDASPTRAFVPLGNNQGAPNQGTQQDSITLGLRYELNDSAALKMEYAIIELDGIQGNRGLFGPSLVSGIDNSKTNLISVAVDVIF